MNRRASGPVLTSLFLFVPDHSAAAVGGSTCDTWNRALSGIANGGLNMTNYNASLFDNSTCLQAFYDYLSSSDSSSSSTSSSSAFTPESLIIVRWLTLALALLFLANEVGQMFVRKLGYVHLSNLVDLFHLCCAILFVLDLEGVGCLVTLEENGKAE